MKKYAILLIACLSLFSACTEDNSTTVGLDNFIHIAGVEKGYHAISYSGDKLQINPTVESSFAPSDLTYTWTCYDTRDADREKTDKKGNGYYVQPDTIGHEQNLDYPVSLSDGEYTFILTVKSKSTGYFQQAVTSLLTQSALSHGFYILKETVDGNTDVDLFISKSNKLLADVIKSNQGQALPGKPRALDINHQLGYIDPKTDDKAGDNFLCITTENDKVYWIRALDCKTLKDNSNFYYEQVPDLKPYRVVRGFFTEFFLTNKGLFHGYTASQRGIGILGELAGYGASKHIVQGSGNVANNMIYWSLPDHSLTMIDYNGNIIDVTGKKVTVGNEEIEYKTKGLNELECIYAGHIFADANAEKAYFLFEDQRNHQKLMYEISPDWDKADLKNVKVIDPNSHYAKASLRAICAKSATIAYAVDQNKIYSYNLVGPLSEKELKFQGLPANEKITFLSNRYFLHETAGFDYLIVGTQMGDTYKLYFYDVIGGEPAGMPKYTTSGKGILKSLGYIDPTVADLDDGAIAPVLDE